MSRSSGLALTYRDPQESIWDLCAKVVHTYNLRDTTEQISNYARLIETNFSQRNEKDRYIAFKEWLYQCSPNPDEFGPQALGLPKDFSKKLLTVVMTSLVPGENCCLLCNSKFMPIYNPGDHNAPKTFGPITHTSSTRAIPLTPLTNGPVTVYCDCLHTICSTCLDRYIDVYTKRAFAPRILCPGALLDLFPLDTFLSVQLSTFISNNTTQWVHSSCQGIIGSIPSTHSLSTKFVALNAFLKARVSAVSTGPNTQQSGCPRHNRTDNVNLALLAGPKTQQNGLAFLLFNNLISCAACLQPSNSRHPQDTIKARCFRCFQCDDLGVTHHDLASLLHKHADAPLLTHNPQNVDSTVLTTSIDTELQYLTHFSANSGTSMGDTSTTISPSYEDLPQYSESPANPIFLSLIQTMNPRTQRSYGGLFTPQHDVRTCAESITRLHDRLTTAFPFAIHTKLPLHFFSQNYETCRNTLKTAVISHKNKLVELGPPIKKCRWCESPIKFGQNDFYTLLHQTMKYYTYIALLTQEQNAKRHSFAPLSSGGSFTSTITGSSTSSVTSLNNSSLSHFRQPISTISSIQDQDTRELIKYAVRTPQIPILFTYLGSGLQFSDCYQSSCDGGLVAKQYGLYVAFMTNFNKWNEGRLTYHDVYPQHAQESSTFDMSHMSVSVDGDATADPIPVKEVWINDLFSMPLYDFQFSVLPPCVQMSLVACPNVLPCGCYCTGVRGESPYDCPPCPVHIEPALKAQRETIMTAREAKKKDRQDKIMNIVNKYDNPLQIPQNIEKRAHNDENITKSTEKGSKLRKPRTLITRSHESERELYAVDDNHRDEARASFHSLRSSFTLLQTSRPYGRQSGYGLPGIPDDYDDDDAATLKKLYTEETLDNQIEGNNDEYRISAYLPLDEKITGPGSVPIPGDISTLNQDECCPLCTEPFCVQPSFISGCSQHEEVQYDLNLSSSKDALCTDDKVRYENEEIPTILSGLYAKFKIFQHREVLLNQTTNHPFFYSDPEHILIPGKNDCEKDYFSKERLENWLLYNFNMDLDRNNTFVSAPSTIPTILSQPNREICQHKHHYLCIAQQLQYGVDRNHTNELNFNFLKCTICRKYIIHPVLLQHTETMRSCALEQFITYLAIDQLFSDLLLTNKNRPKIRRILRRSRTKHNNNPNLISYKYDALRHYINSEIEAQRHHLEMASNHNFAQDKIEEILDEHEESTQNESISPENHQNLSQKDENGDNNQNHRIIPRSADSSHDSLAELATCADEIIFDPVYYNRPEDYALSRYVYYQCHQCYKPYFGGLLECQAASVPADEESNNKKPVMLLCPSCNPTQGRICTQHDVKHLIYKCKFCCNVAVYHCWGNTYFCEAHHKSGVWQEYVHQKTGTNKKTLLQYQQCPSLYAKLNALHAQMLASICSDPAASSSGLCGVQKSASALANFNSLFDDKASALRCDPAQCPLKIPHPPNGINFVIGCAQCGVLHNQISDTTTPTEELETESDQDDDEHCIDHDDHDDDHDDDYELGFYERKHYETLKKNTNLDVAKKLAKSPPNLDISNHPLKDEESPRPTRLLARYINRINHSASSSNDSSVPNSGQCTPKSLSRSLNTGAPSYTSTSCSSRHRTSKYGQSSVIQYKPHYQHTILPQSLLEIDIPVYQQFSLYSHLLLLNNITEHFAPSSISLSHELIKNPSPPQIYSQRRYILRSHQFDNDLNGIIWYLGTLANTARFTNPHQISLVECTHSKHIASLAHGSLPAYGILEKSDARCVIQPVKLNKNELKQPLPRDSEPYFTLDMKMFRVIPTGYSIKHYDSHDNECLRYWVLEASGDGELWHTLSVHNDDKQLKGKNSLAHWPIDQFNARFQQLKESQITAAAITDHAFSTPHHTTTGHNELDYGINNHLLYLLPPEVITPPYTPIPPSEIPPAATTTDLSRLYPNGFRFFRIRQRGPTDLGSRFFPLTGLELYGALIIPSYQDISCAMSTLYNYHCAHTGSLSKSSTHSIILEQKQCQTNEINPIFLTQASLLPDCIPILLSPPVRQGGSQEHYLRRPFAREKLIKDMQLWTILQYYWSRSKLTHLNRQNNRLCFSKGFRSYSNLEDMDLSGSQHQPNSLQSPPTTINNNNNYSNNDNQEYIELDDIPPLEDFCRRSAYAYFLPELHHMPCKREELPETMSEAIHGLSAEEVQQNQENQACSVLEGTGLSMQLPVQSSSSVDLAQYGVANAAFSSKTAQTELSTISSTQSMRSNPVPVSHLSFAPQNSTNLPQTSTQKMKKTRKKQQIFLTKPIYSFTDPTDVDLRYLLRTLGASAVFPVSIHSTTATHAGWVNMYGKLVHNAKVDAHNAQKHLSAEAEAQKQEGALQNLAKMNELQKILKKKVDAIKTVQPPPPEPSMFPYLSLLNSAAKVAVNPVKLGAISIVSSGLTYNSFQSQYLASSTSSAFTTGLAVLVEPPTPQIISNNVDIMKQNHHNKRNITENLGLSGLLKSGRLTSPFISIVPSQLPLFELTEWDNIQTLTAEHLLKMFETSQNDQISRKTCFPIRFMLQVMYKCAFLREQLVPNVPHEPPTLQSRNLAHHYAYTTVDFGAYRVVPHAFALNVSIHPLDLITDYILSAQNIDENVKKTEHSPQITTTLQVSPLLPPRFMINSPESLESIKSLILTKFEHILDTWLDQNIMTSWVVEGSNGEFPHPFRLNSPLLPKNVQISTNSHNLHSLGDSSLDYKPHQYFQFHTHIDPNYIQPHALNTPTFPGLHELGDSGCTDYISQSIAHIHEKIAYQDNTNWTWYPLSIHHKDNSLRNHVKKQILTDFLANFNNYCIPALFLEDFDRINRYLLSEHSIPPQNTQSAFNSQHGIEKLGKFDTSRDIIINKPGAVNKFGGALVASLLGENANVFPQNISNLDKLGLDHEDPPTIHTPDFYKKPIDFIPFCRFDIFNVNSFPEKSEQQPISRKFVCNYDLFENDPYSYLNDPNCIDFLHYGPNIDSLCTQSNNQQPSPHIDMVSVENFDMVSILHLIQTFPTVSLSSNNGNVSQIVAFDRLTQDKSLENNNNNENNDTNKKPIGDTSQYYPPSYKYIRIRSLHHNTTMILSDLDFFGEILTTTSPLNARVIDVTPQPPECSRLPTSINGHSLKKPDYSSMIQNNAHFQLIRKLYPHIPLESLYRMYNQSNPTQSTIATNNILTNNIPLLPVLTPLHPQTDHTPQIFLFLYKIINYLLFIISFNYYTLMSVGTTQHAIVCTVDWTIISQKMPSFNRLINQSLRHIHALSNCIFAAHGMSHSDPTVSRGIRSIPQLTVSSQYTPLPLNTPTNISNTPTTNQLFSALLPPSTTLPDHTLAVEQHQLAILSSALPYLPSALHGSLQPTTVVTRNDPLSPPQPYDLTPSEKALITITQDHPLPITPTFTQPQFFPDPTSPPPNLPDDALCQQLLYFPTTHDSYIVDLLTITERPPWFQESRTIAGDIYLCTGKWSTFLGYSRGGVKVTKLNTGDTITSHRLLATYHSLSRDIYHNNAISSNATQTPHLSLDLAPVTKSQSILTPSGHIRTAALLAVSLSSENSSKLLILLPNYKSFKSVDLTPSHFSPGALHANPRIPPPPPGWLCLYILQEARYCNFVPILDIFGSNGPLSANSVDFTAISDMTRATVINIVREHVKLAYRYNESPSLMTTIAPNHYEPYYSSHYHASTFIQPYNYTAKLQSIAPKNPHKQSTTHPTKSPCSTPPVILPPLLQNVIKSLNIPGLTVSSHFYTPIHRQYYQTNHPIDLNAVTSTESTVTGDIYSGDLLSCVLEFPSSSFAQNALDSSDVCFEKFHDLLFKRLQHHVYHANVLKIVPGIISYIGTRGGTQNYTNPLGSEKMQLALFYSYVNTVMCPRYCKNVTTNGRSLGSFKLGCKPPVSSSTFNNFNHLASQYEAGTYLDVLLLNARGFVNPNSTNMVNLQVFREHIFQPFFRHAIAHKSTTTYKTQIIDQYENVFSLELTENDENYENNKNYFNDYSNNTLLYNTFTTDPSILKLRPSGPGEPRKHTSAFAPSYPHTIHPTDLLPLKFTMTAISSLPHIHRTIHHTHIPTTQLKRQSAQQGAYTPDKDTAFFTTPKTAPIYPVSVLAAYEPHTTQIKALTGTSPLSPNLSALGYTQYLSRLKKELSNTSGDLLNIDIISNIKTDGDYKSDQGRDLINYLENSVLIGGTNSFYALDMSFHPKSANAYPSQEQSYRTLAISHYNTRLALPPANPSTLSSTHNNDSQGHKSLTSTIIPQSINNNSANNTSSINFAQSTLLKGSISSKSINHNDKYILFDFGPYTRILPTSYSISVPLTTQLYRSTGVNNATTYNTVHPRNWQLVGSVNGLHWHLLSNHNNDTTLTNINPSATWALIPTTSPTPLPDANECDGLRHPDKILHNNTKQPSLAHSMDTPLPEDPHAHCGFYRSNPEAECIQFHFLSNYLSPTDTSSTTTTTTTSDADLASNPFIIASDDLMIQHMAQYALPTGSLLPLPAYRFFAIIPLYHSDNILPPSISPTPSCNTSSMGSNNLPLPFVLSNIEFYGTIISSSAPLSAVPYPCPAGSITVPKPYTYLYASATSPQFSRVTSLSFDQQLPQYRRLVSQTSIISSNPSSSGKTGDLSGSSTAENTSSPTHSSSVLVPYHSSPSSKISELVTDPCDDTVEKFLDELSGFKNNGTTGRHASCSTIELEPVCIIHGSHCCENCCDDIRHTRYAFNQIQAKLVKYIELRTNPLVLSPIVAILPNHNISLQRLGQKPGQVPGYLPYILNTAPPAYHTHATDTVCQYYNCRTNAGINETNLQTDETSSHLQKLMRFNYNYKNNELSTQHVAEFMVTHHSLPKELLPHKKSYNVRKLREFILKQLSNGKITIDDDDGGDDGGNSCFNNDSMTTPSPSKRIAHRYINNVAGFFQAFTELCDKCGIIPQSISPVVNVPQIKSPSEHFLQKDVFKWTSSEKNISYLTIFQESEALFDSTLLSPSPTNNLLCNITPNDGQNDDVISQLVILYQEKLKLATHNDSKSDSNEHISTNSVPSNNVSSQQNPTPIIPKFKLCFMGTNPMKYVSSFLSRRWKCEKSQQLESYRCDNAPMQYGFMKAVASPAPAQSYPFQYLQSTNGVVSLHKDTFSLQTDPTLLLYPSAAQLQTNEICTNIAFMTTHDQTGLNDQEHSIVFDFGVFVQPHSYSISHSYIPSPTPHPYQQQNDKQVTSTQLHSDFNKEFLRSWVLMGSQTGNDWFVLSSHDNDCTIQSQGTTYSFPISKRAATRKYFRYFKIMATGPNACGLHSLCLGSFDVSGNVRLIPPTRDDLSQEYLPQP